MDDGCVAEFDTPERLQMNENSLFNKLLKSVSE
jgi:ABC-type multidrug transport system fused ATPase/permease subunit